MLLASYTASGDYSKWLGGRDAFVSQTKQSTRRLLGTLEAIQADPMYVGHVSGRLVRATPVATERLTEYGTDPLKYRDRINYHACMLSLSIGELLILLDDPPAAAACQGGQLRSNACKQLVANALTVQDAQGGGRFLEFCRWGLPEGQ